MDDDVILVLAKEPIAQQLVEQPAYLDVEDHGVEALKDRVVHVLHVAH